MKSLGICIGASTLSVVEAVISGTGRITARPLIARLHNGDPRAALLDVLADLPWDERLMVAVTGRKLRQAVNFSTISESS